MIPATVVQFRVRLPGDGGAGAPPFRPPSPLFRDSPLGWTQPGWIDTASNFGVPAKADWARMWGAFRMPITIGTARVEIPATARTVFFAMFNLNTRRFVIITSIRFLRFDPVTPDTHARGDSA